MTSDTKMRTSRIRCLLQNFFSIESVVQMEEVTLPVVPAMEGAGSFCGASELNL
jgi:hypothetical protein